MADIPYVLNYFPGEPAQHVARTAILRRLEPHRRGRPPAANLSLAEWAGLFDYVLGLWRHRAAALCQQDQAPFRLGQLGYLRNCPPFGVAVQGAPSGALVYTCRYSAICPWCAGREAGALYHAVTTLYRPGDSLCRILGTRTLASASPEQLRAELIELREVLRDLTYGYARRTRGAYWTVTAEPLSTGERRPGAYRLVARWLALFRPGCLFTLRPYGKGWNLGFVPDPPPAIFQRAVAGVCLYPVGLLKGPAAEVVRVLQARSKLRLCERSGAFRGFAGEQLDGTEAETALDGEADELTSTEIHKN